MKAEAAVTKLSRPADAGKSESTWEGRWGRMLVEAAPAEREGCSVVATTFDR